MKGRKWNRVMWWNMIGLLRQGNQGRLLWGGSLAAELWRLWGFLLNQSAPPRTTCLETSSSRGILMCSKVRVCLLNTQSFLDKCPQSFQLLLMWPNLALLGIVLNQSWIFTYNVYHRMKHRVLPARKDYIRPFVLDAAFLFIQPK